MLQQHIHHQESGKQPKEDTATEYHRCLRVISKHLFDPAEIYINGKHSHYKR